MTEGPMAESYTFKWPMNQLEEGNKYKYLSNANIFLTGDFDNWSKTAKLTPNYKEQVYEVNLPTEQFDGVGRFNFKFYFANDDSWRCSDDYPIEDDGHGNQNNYITGAEMIKQAEKVELERRKNHQYSEAEAINEEIINELQVSSLDSEKATTNIDYNKYEAKEEAEEEKEEAIEEETKPKPDINERLAELESEREEFRKDYAEDQSAKQLGVSDSVTEFMKTPEHNESPSSPPAEISFVPTENETLEDAIKNKEEHVPVLVHNPEREDNIENAPVETLVDTEKKEPVAEAAPETQNNDVDDIPTENRRKLKIKRKVKKNKKTGERIVVSMEIFELDQDDNVIATYSSMEEAEKARAPTEMEQEEPKERLYEIENVNEADVTSNSSAIVSPHEEDQGELSAIKEVGSLSGSSSSGEEAEIPMVNELNDTSYSQEKSPEEEAEIPMVINNGGDQIPTDTNENEPEVTETEPVITEEEINSNIEGEDPTAVVENPVIAQEVPIEETNVVVEENVNEEQHEEPQQVEATSAHESDDAPPYESKEDDNPMANEEATVVNDTGKDVPLKPVAEKKKPAAKKPAAKKPSTTTEEKPKKKGMFSKLKRAFF